MLVWSCFSVQSRHDTEPDKTLHFILHRLQETLSLTWSTYVYNSAFYGLVVVTVSFPRVAAIILLSWIRHPLKPTAML